MPLNFLKNKTEKTDATLQFSSVLNDVKQINTLLIPLDIDQFVTSTGIHLEQDQDLYNESSQKEALPDQLETDKEYSVHSTRLLADALLDLSKTLPETKQKMAGCREQVKMCLEKNTQIMEEMESIK